MRRFKKAWIPIIVVPPLLFAFQNCGEFNASSGIENSSPIATAPVSGQRFLKGQTLNSEILPYNVDASAKENMKSYLQLTNFKAVAFSEDGQVFIVDKDIVQSQSEINRIALEVCQLKSKNRACAIFAEGNLVKFDEDDFFKSHAKVLENTTVYDHSRLPALADHWKEYFSKNYPGKNIFDSIAVDGGGGVYRGWSDDSQEDSNSRAIQFCEAPGQSKCALYAEGLKVVFDLDKINYSSHTVLYGPKPLVASEIPFISHQVRMERAIPLINELVQQKRHIAIAINRYGVWYGKSSVDAISNQELQALVESCTALIRRAEPDSPGFKHRCFLYSVDNNVVMTRDSFAEAALGEI